MSLAARREAIDRAIAAHRAGREHPFRPGEGYAPPSAEDVRLRELVVTALSELEHTVKRIERAKPAAPVQRAKHGGPYHRLRALRPILDNRDEEEPK